MGLQIIRNDITQLTTDAIVNTANPKPCIGTGVDRAIHKAAGPELLKARERIGRIEVGEARATEAFKLHAQYVIHVVGPVWDGGNKNEVEDLKSAYRNALELAERLGCKSISFPLLSTGNYGFPLSQAILIAVNEINTFLIEHEEIDVILVAFSDEASNLVNRLVKSRIKAEIKKRDVKEKLQEEYEIENGKPIIGLSRYWAMHKLDNLDPLHSIEHGVAWTQPSEEMSLDLFLHTCTPSFPELFKKFQKRCGKNYSVIAKDVCLDKSLVSKIVNQGYIPLKETQILLAFSMKLTLAETQELLGSSGYILSDSIERDMIVRYFLAHSIYSVSDLCSTIAERGLKSLYIKEI